MYSAAGKKLDIVDRFALGFFKAVEAASGIAADGGLAAFGDDRAQGSRKALAIFGF